MTAEKTRLEALNATYEGWADKSKSIREAAGKAKAELGRRGQPQPQERPRAMAGWWRQLDADLDAMDRAIGREHQALIAAGKPWPPHHIAQAETTPAKAAAVIARLQHDGYLPEPNPALDVSAPAASDTEPLAPQHEPDHRSARLDTLQARANEAAHRIAADNAEREARAQYTAHLERQAHAQAEPAAEHQPEASDGIEIEP